MRRHENARQEPKLNIYAPLAGNKKHVNSELSFLDISKNTFLNKFSISSLR